MTIKSLSIVAAAALALCAGAAQAQVSGLANAGFEAAADGPGEFADGWRAAQQTFVPVRTMEQAHSGSWSAMLAVPTPGGVGLFQNSFDHGGLVAVDPVNWGTAPTLSFWVKGNSSETGNLNYALRYLDAGGIILNPGSQGATTIWTGNIDRPWTPITRTPDTVIPVNTAAVFFEMTFAAGPSGIFPGCGPEGSLCNWGDAKVFLDDVSIQLAVPEPSTYAMMLAGLAGVGFLARRRRAV